MIKAIQQFEPREIDVSNIVKSLILQAKYHKLNTNITKIFKRADLLKNTQNKLKEKLNISTQD